jgi:hypothetical protein
MTRVMCRCRTAAKLLSRREYRKLEEFLNSVANERDNDSSELGGGTFPSHNANKAREMLKILRMKRRKPKWLT